MNIRDFFWAYMDLWVESNKGSDATTYDQCIDLWRTYNRKVIQAPDIFGNPPDIWDKYQSDYYDRIPNTPDGIPQLGDVIIWGTKYGKYGHIAICTELANTSKFTTFDQNDPLGSSCHFQPHTYTGVLGWLRPKNQSVLEVPKPEAATEAGTDTQIQGYKKFIDDLVAIIRPPEDKRDFAGLLGVTQELKVRADSTPTLEQKHQEFINKVAEGIGCADKTETAVLGALMDIQSHISYIKTQRLEEFPAIERVISGLRALFHR